MWLELVRTSVPILLAWVPLLILAKQIRQQNRLERAKVEVEYLRNALAVLELPVRAVTKVQSQVDDTILAQTYDGLTMEQTKERARQIALEWDEALERHDSALFVAMAFASQQQEQRLAEGLAAASGSAHDLSLSVKRAMRSLVKVDSTDILPGKEFAERFEVKRAIEAWHGAATLIVHRIHRLYM